MKDIFAFAGGKRITAASSMTTCESTPPQVHELMGQQPRSATAEVEAKAATEPAELSTTNLSLSIRAAGAVGLGLLPLRRSGGDNTVCQSDPALSPCISCYFGSPPLGATPPTAFEDSPELDGTPMYCRPCHGQQYQEP
jgi:hypothetical protein